VTDDEEDPPSEEQARVVSWKIDLDYDDDEGDSKPTPTRRLPPAPVRVPAAA
jgi:hypothetical protein